MKLKYGILPTKWNTNIGVFARFYHGFYRFSHCPGKNSFWCEELISDCVSVSQAAETMADH